MPGHALGSLEVGVRALGHRGIENEKYIGNANTEAYLYQDLTTGRPCGPLHTTNSPEPAQSPFTASIHFQPEVASQPIDHVMQPPVAMSAGEAL